LRTQHRRVRTLDRSDSTVDNAHRRRANAVRQYDAFAAEKPLGHAGGTPTSAKGTSGSVSRQNWRNRFPATNRR